MNYLTYIFFLIVLSFNVQAQELVKFRNGDHIYLLETNHGIPLYHQVSPCDPDGFIEFYIELIRDGIPAFEIYFDPSDYRFITLRQDENGKMRVLSLPDQLNKRLLAVNPDPKTQPIFYNGNVELSQERYLWILTPHLTRATSFKICTNNRVFVFVKRPQLISKEL